MGKLKYDKSRTSQDLQREYQEICTKLGAEIRNEERAQENQAILRGRQKEVEEAYNQAARRENEAAAAKNRDEERAKAEEARKAKDPAQQSA